MNEFYHFASHNPGLTFFLGVLLMITICDVSCSFSKIFRKCECNEEDNIDESSIS